MTDQTPATYRTSPVVSCRIEGEEDAILFNPDTDNTCLLNGTGIALWQFLTTARSEGEICEHLADQYDEIPEQETLLADTRAFLKRLEGEYLIREPGHGS